MFMDLSGLSGATGLQHLYLHGGVHNRQVVASLAGLQSIQVLSYCRLYTPLVPHLGGLQQLRSIKMPGDPCHAEDWSALAQLPLLEEVEFEALLVCCRSSRPAAVTSISCASFTLLLPGSPSQQGCLGALLPRLRELCVHVVGDLQQLVAVLSGHAALQALQVGVMHELYHGAADWAQQQLSCLPALQRLVVEADVLEPDALLEDLAGSSSVRSIRIGHTRAAEVGSGRGLAALAAGACRHSLEELRVVRQECCHGRAMPCSTAKQVAGLLGGSMAALRLVELEVVLPGRDLGRGDEVQRQLPALLRQLGAVGDWACSCLAVKEDAAGSWYAPVLLQPASQPGRPSPNLST
jgi:hypothetical protein